MPSLTHTSDTVQPVAIIALVMGSAAVALAPILVRLAEVSPSASAFWRMALAAPVLWMWVCFSERKCKKTATETPWKLLALAGFFFAADLAAWHWSILLTSVSNASLELNLAPVFVALGGWFIFGQRISRLFFAALCVTLVGAAILIGPHFDGAEAALMGDGLGIFAGLVYAGYLLTLKPALHRTSIARVMAVSTTMAALFLAPFALATADRLVPSHVNGGLILGALAVVPHVLGQSLVAYGFGRLPTAFSSVSLLLQPVFASFYAWALLHEAMTPTQLMGGAIVLLGIYLAKRAS